VENSGMEIADKRTGMKSAGMEIAGRKCRYENSNDLSLT